MNNPKAAVYFRFASVEALDESNIESGYRNAWLFDRRNNAGDELSRAAQMKAFREKCEAGGYTIIGETVVVGDGKMTLPVIQNILSQEKDIKSDEEFLSEITNLLNRIIASPDMIQDSVKMGQEPNVEIQRLNHEIESMLNGLHFDKSALREKMLARVSLQYQSIAPEHSIIKQLRADFANADPLSAFSAESFNKIVKTICVEKNGSISIILINNQQIRKDS